jgi:hypothetical protein
LLDVLNKPLDSTFVVIQEVELENWDWAACRCLSSASNDRPGEGASLQWGRVRLAKESS